MKVYEATSDNIVVRSEPNGGNSSISGTISKGTTLYVEEEKEGYVKTQYGWVNDSQVRLVSIDGVTQRNTISRSVSRASSRAATSTVTVNTSNATNSTRVVPLTTKNAQDYKVKTTLDQRLLRNSGALCIPPQFCSAADPQIYEGYKIGRVYAESVLSHAIVVSMCPCKVKYLPTFTKEEQKTFFDSVLASAKGIEGALNRDYEADGAGNFYEATGAWRTHINRVNAILRLTSIMMGIGDKKVPGTNTAYKNFSWDTGYGSLTDGTVTGGNNGGGVIGTLSSMFTGAKDVFAEAFHAIEEGVISDGTYIHFYADGDNTSYSDDHQNTTRSSAIESALSTVDDLAKEFNFLMGEVQDSKISEDVNRAIDGLGDGFIANILKTGRGYFEGARLAFPQILDSSTFGRSINVSLKCVAPCADPEAIFLYTMVPQAHIMAMALPGQYSSNMYTFPPIVKINCTGWFNCDLAVISDLRITRGGSDSRMWSVDRLATETEITFTVTPLYSQLMVPTTSKPFSALFNRGFMEYIASISGIDMKVNNVDLKAEMLKMIASGARPDNMARNSVMGLSRSLLDSSAIQFAQKMLRMP